MNRLDYKPLILDQCGCYVKVTLFEPFIYIVKMYKIRPIHMI